MKDNPSVVIVCKGSSLLERKIGDLIDSFDIVIRANHFPVYDSIKQHIGSRTTIFSSGSRTKVRANLDMISTIKKLWICESYKNWTIPKDCVGDTTEEINKMLSTFKTNEIDFTFMTDSEEMDLARIFSNYGDIYRPYDVRVNACMPNTGIITLYNTLNRFKSSKIYVCGMDLCLNGNK
ncbi:MAG: hypothetical protein EBU90_30670, partial [Proteobacteria bacterium]|nr:hypothetical protein [Pseudomonadota bacterium]